MTRKNYLLLALPMLLWGCETLPFRWGESVDVDSLVAKNSKPAKVVPLNDNRVLRVADANKVAEGRLVETKLVEKKISYKVVKGDTIYSLARQNSMTPADLAKANDLKLTDQLKVGQTITIIKKVTENVESATNATTNDGITLPKKQAAVEQGNIANNDGGDTADKPARFAWPVQGGNIVQKFGEGVSQDGVILSGALGQNIFAVAGGQVIYVGTDIKPLGLLVLIKHDNGFVSTYGYLQKSLVKKGDEIKRGQAIAALGQSGSAQRPQLYFEIRKNNKPSNPLNYLSATPPAGKATPAKTPATNPAPAKAKTGN